MLDVLDTIKTEIVDDKFIATVKDFVAKVGSQTTIVFVCNSKLAKNQLLTVSSRVMFRDQFKGFVGGIARRCGADGIITVITAEDRSGQVCMSVTVETLLSSYGVFYPYERVGYNQVNWQDPVQLELPARYADLLPAPDGMAQA